MYIVINIKSNLQKCNVCWTFFSQRTLKFFELSRFVYIIEIENKIPMLSTGACHDFFVSLDYSKKPQGRNLKCQISIQHFFKIVLYWCLDLIRHNIDTHLKYNKYIFDISIPFCHHFYLSATLKQCFTEFAVSSNVHSSQLRLIPYLHHTSSVLR